MEKVVGLNYKGDAYQVSCEYRKNNEHLLFCIHGLGCGKDSFSEIFKSNLLKEYSVLAIDSIGYGKSSRGESFSFKMEDQAEICRLVLDKYEHSKIHILGHSMGGAIGLLLYDLIPEKISSFVNIEGNLVREDCSILSRRTIAVSEKEFIESFFQAIRKQFILSKDPSFKLWAEWSASADPRGFYKSSESLVYWSDNGELLKKFKNIQIPKIYFYGEKNKEMLLLNLIPEIKKVMIDRAGHFIFNDNPDPFCRELRDFLKSK
ncbi:MAG: alpha/beta hydrolase [bacterium]|nr:alpha/beta hydrolase [bacterium]